jgi:hypothetical protein
MIKMWCYWEHLGEPFANLMGTHWEQNKNPKNPPPPLSKPKRKKLGPLEAMLSLLIGCMEFVFLKLFATIFYLG